MSDDAMDKAVSFQINEISRLRKIIFKLNEEIKILKHIKDLDEFDKLRLPDGFKKEEVESGHTNYPDELLKGFPEYW